NVILTAEAYAYHEANLQAEPEKYGSRFLGRLRLGALLSSTDYLTAARGRAKINRAMDDLMRRIDLIAMPTFVYPAVTFAEYAATPAWARTSLTRPFNVTGQPAISVPCGFSSLGLPIGLQLAGRAFEDATVLQAAHAYEQATDWHT